MKDAFFTKTHCDRCGQSLGEPRISTMSWFTEECICMDCRDKEKPIKAALRAKGISNAMEGCGFIPNVERA
jgi:hypothetical protein